MSDADGLPTGPVDPGAEVAALAERASRLWRQGALRACIEQLEAARIRLVDNPNLTSAEVREGVAVRLGAARIRLGRLREALPGLLALLDATDSGYASLQLGSALRHLGDEREAEHHLQRAYERARLGRDGVLAIAALCGVGELRLDADDERAALESFGQALGLSEFGSDERPSVAPLSGLARSHARGGNPAKGAELAQRALERAIRSHDRTGEARARHAVAVCAAPDRTLFERAERSARLAPHLPMWLHVRCGRWHDLDPSERGHTAAAAADMDMPLPPGARP